MRNEINFRRYCKFDWISQYFSWWKVCFPFNPQPVSSWIDLQEIVFNLQSCIKSMALYLRPRDIKNWTEWNWNSFWGSIGLLSRCDMEQGCKNIPTLRSNSNVILVANTPSSITALMEYWNYIPWFFAERSWFNNCYCDACPQGYLSMHISANHKGFAMQHSIAERRMRNLVGWIITF